MGEWPRPNDVTLERLLPDLLEDGRNREAGGLEWKWQFYPPGTETKIFQDSLVNTMPADALAPCISRERERLSLSAFLGTEDIGVHIVHISHVIITYTLEELSSLT